MLRPVVVIACISLGAFAAGRWAGSVVAPAGITPLGESAQVTAETGAGGPVSNASLDTARPPGSSAADRSTIPTSVADCLALDGIDRTLALARFLPTADASEVQELMETFLANESAHYLQRREAVQPAWWYLGALRWFEVDPAAAEAFVHRPMSSGRGTGPILAAWATVDPAAALDAAAKISPRSLRHLLGTIARTDPGLARDLGGDHLDPADLAFVIAQSQNPDDTASLLDLALALPDRKRRRETFESVFTAAAADDPGRAVELAQALDDNQFRQLALLKVGEQLTRSWEGPDLFRTVFSGLDPSAKRSSLAIDASAKWGAEDRDGVLAWANDQLHGPELHAALAAILNAANPSDPDALLAYFDEHGWNIDIANSTQGSSTQHPNGGGGSSMRGRNSMSSILSRHLQEMATDDPHAALARIADLPDPETRADILGDVVRVWFDSDPEAAASWASKLPRALEGYRARNAITSAFESWAGRDPDAARSFMTKADFVSDEVFGTALAHVAAASLPPTGDRTTTLDWLRSFPDETRPTAVAKLVSSVARDAPAVAAEVIADLGPSGVRGYDLATVATGLFRSSPQAATEWLDRLPPETDASRAHQQVASRWATGERHAVEGWVSSLADGPNRDGAVAGLVESMVAPQPDGEARDYESAIAWALTIQGRDERKRALTRASEQWVNGDSAGVAEFLATERPPAGELTEAIEAALSQENN